MQKLCYTPLLVFFLLLPGQAIADGNTGVEFDQVTPLSDAVEKFNVRVKGMSEIGRAQPPLTVDEVVASIRRWDRNRTPIEPGLKAVFDRIAETQQMPPDSALMFGTGLLADREYRFTVWWVDLHLYYPRPDRDPEDSKFVYIHRIRDRTISSRRLTQDDLDRMDSDSSALSLPERERLAAKHFAGFVSGEHSIQDANTHSEERVIIQRFARVRQSFDLDTKIWLLKHVSAKSPEESVSRYDECPLWSYIPQVMTIAEEDKEGLVSLDIAEWIVVNAGRVGLDDRRMYDADAKIMTLLKDLDLNDDRLARLFAKIGDQWSPAREALLRSRLTEGSPDRLKAVACVALAMGWRQLKDRSESQDLVEKANRLGTLDAFTLHLTALRSNDLESKLMDSEFVQARTAEAERLLDQAKHEFGDVPYPSDRYQGTVGDMVALLREGSLPSPLDVGSTAPQIDGVDLEGSPLKLSDYRGQIVVINFWSSTCIPCLKKMAPLNSFADKYRDDVIVLGVNTDSDHENALLAEKKHATTWRSWHDSALSKDSIAIRYKVAYNPCVFVLDENGVIRSNKTSEISDIEETVQILLKNRAGKR